MGHKVLVLKPRCIGPGRARTQLLFYSKHEDYVIAVTTCIYRYMHKRKCNRYTGNGIATTLITVVNISQS